MSVLNSFKDKSKLLSWNSGQGFLVWLLDDLRSESMFFDYWTATNQHSEFLVLDLLAFGNKIVKSYFCKLGHT